MRVLCLFQLLATVSCVRELGRIHLSEEDFGSVVSFNSTRTTQARQGTPQVLASVPCSLVKGLDCSPREGRSSAPTIFFDGGDSSSACISSSTFKRAFIHHKCSDTTAKGDIFVDITKNGKTKRKKCCVCPPGATWSTLSGSCVCSHLGTAGLPPVNGLCPTSRDKSTIEQAYADLSKKNNKYLKKLGLTKEDLAAFAEEAPARQEIKLAKEYCVVHRDVDELYPASRSAFEVLRMGMGVDIGIGTLAAVAMHILDFIELNVNLRLDNTEHGLKLTIEHPDGPDANTPMVKVGVEGLTLWIGSDVYHLEGKSYNKSKVYQNGGYVDEHMITAVGRLSGSDYLNDIIKYKTSSNIKFELSERIQLHQAKTGNFLLDKLISTDTALDQIKGILEWIVSDILSKNVFAVIAMQAQNAALEEAQIAKISPYPLVASVKAFPPEKKQYGNTTKLIVSIQQGMPWKAGMEKVLGGISRPNISGKVAVAGDKVHMSVDAVSTLDTKGLISEQANSWNSAVLETAEDEDGPSYRDEVVSQEQKASKEKHIDNSEKDKHTKEESTKFAQCKGRQSGRQSHLVWRLAGAGWGLINSVAGYFGKSAPSPETPFETKLPSSILNPGEKRAALEENLLNLWKEQHPGHVGILSRTSKRGDPDYYVIGLEDLHYKIHGSVEATVTRLGQAALTGSLTIGQLDLKNFLYEYLQPQACHADDSCDYKSNAAYKWQGVTGTSLVASLAVKTPLKVAISGHIDAWKGLQVCAYLEGDLELQDQDSWTAWIANKVASSMLLMQYIENFLEQSLTEVLSKVFAQFADKGLKKLDVKLDLDSAKQSAALKVGADGTWSTLAQQQTRAASIPAVTTTLESDMVGRGYHMMRSHFMSDPTWKQDLPRITTKLSLAPETWMKHGYYFALSDLLPALEVDLKLTPYDESNPFLRTTGFLEIDLRNILRSMLNDYGAYDYGEHMVGVDEVEIGGKQVKAIVSCGNLYLPQKKEKAEGNVLYGSKASIYDFSAKASKGDVGIVHPIDSSKDYGCASGKAGFAIERNQKTKTVCVSKDSLLYKAAKYESERSKFINDILKSGDSFMKSSAAWVWQGTPEKFGPFSWKSGGRSKEAATIVSQKCAQQVASCSKTLACHGVSFHSKEEELFAEDSCVFLNLDDMAACRDASMEQPCKYKEWHVGPPSEWGDAKTEAKDLYH